MRRPAAAETRAVRQGDQLHRDWHQLFPSCLSKCLVFKLFLTIAQVSLGLNGQHKNNRFQGWGFSSVVERLPSKGKALGSVPSSEKKKKKQRAIKVIILDSASFFSLDNSCH